MKKITFLFLLTLFTYSGFSQISEGFEGTTFPPTGWASFIGANGLGTVENWKRQAFEAGNNTAVCVWEVIPGGQRSEDWLVTPQVTVSASDPFLTFDGIDSGTTDYGSIYTVRVSTASQTTHSDFVIVDTQNETQIAHSQTTMLGSTRSIDLSAYIDQSIYIAFVLEQNDGDLWRIDNVEIDSNLSVEEENVNSFSVSPNPAKDQVSITTLLAIDSVEFYNELGQRVLNINGSSIHNNSVSISSLKSGLYFMNISAEGNNQIIKVIKE